MNIVEYENYQENKDHSLADFPYNTYLCSIPLDFTEVPLHWHDEMEIIYIKKGRGIVTVDFRSYHVEGPNLILVRPGQLHSIEQYRDDSMEYENILFSPNLLMSKAEESRIMNFMSGFLSGLIRVPTHFTPVYPYYEDIASCIDACDEIMKTRPQGYEFFIKSKLFELLFVLDNRCKNFGPEDSNKKTLEKMRIVLKYVENHYRDHIAVADVAKISGFSESHFMRYFKDAMGSSFIDYLKDYRLTMAARMLQSSEESILIISEEAGFSNLSYFNRSFKDKYKMTPREYRKQCQ